MSRDEVFIVDDDEAIRDALTWLFQSRGLNARSWDSAEAFLADWHSALAGCLVLDVRMGGMSGLDLFERLRTLQSQLPVIFLTGHGDVPMAVAALKRGARDFVEKPFNDNELVDMVEATLARAAADRVQARETADAAARLDTLSVREKQVMELILAGKMNKVIAEELGVTMRTVEVHRARILEKMAVKTAVELAGMVATLRNRHPAP